jgi:predicted CopG family antitoxin
MIRTQILLEPEQHEMLKEIAQIENKSVSEIVREMLSKQIMEQQRRRLNLAAHELLADYQVDQDLTVFTALDGEDFHA